MQSALKQLTFANLKVLDALAFITSSNTLSANPFYSLWKGFWEHQDFDVN